MSASGRASQAGLAQTERNGRAHVRGGADLDWNSITSTSAKRSVPSRDALRAAGVECWVLDMGGNVITGFKTKPVAHDWAGPPSARRARAGRVLLDAPTRRLPSRPRATCCRNEDEVGGADLPALSTSSSARRSRRGRVRAGALRDVRYIRVRGRARVWPPPREHQRRARRLHDAAGLAVRAVRRDRHLAQVGRHLPYGDARPWPSRAPTTTVSRRCGTRAASAGRRLVRERRCRRQRRLDAPVAALVRPARSTTSSA